MSVARRLAAHSVGMVLIARAVCALDPARPLSALLLDSWSTREGLPQSSVNALVQDADGYLWIGTQDGLVRFDGTTFTAYGVGGAPPLPSGYVGSLAVDGRTLWIGTEAGLVRYRSGAFATVPAAAPLAAVRIRALHLDVGGGLWVGTSAGLATLRDDRLVEVQLAGHDAVHVTALWLGGDGALWIGTARDGLLRLERGGALTRWTTADGLAADRVTALAGAADKGVWVGTPRGLQLLAGGVLRTYGTRDGLPSAEVLSLRSGAGDELWIGTFGGGVTRLAGGRFSSLRRAGGLPCDTVLATYEDREGILWLGTQTGGLARARDVGISLIGKAHGLPSEVTGAVLEDRDGRLLAGTHDSGLIAVAGERVRRHAIADGLLDERVRALLVDGRGDVWVGGAAGSVQRLRGAHLEPSGTEFHVDDHEVRALCEDGTGGLWIGTTGGTLACVRNGVLTVPSLAPALPPGRVAALLADRRGALWVAVYGAGVVRIENGRTTVLGAQAGLTSPLAVALTEDRDGQVWVGSYGGGLYRIDGDRLHRYATEQGLCSDVIYGIVEDAADRLWMTSNQGVFVVAREALRGIDEGRASTMPCVYLNRQAGLGNIEFNGAMQPPGWRTRDGRILFPSMLGLAVIDPARATATRPQPRIALEGVVADGRRLTPDITARLPAATRRIELSFVGVSLLAPGAVGYRYRLEGFDPDWVDAGGSRSAVYTTLGPGRYRFVVQAHGAGTGWGEDAASFAFTVATPWWRQTWFLALAVIGLLGSVYALGRARQAHAQRAERRRVELVHSLTVGLLHELRQPLQALHTRLEIVRLRARGSEQLAHGVGEALSEAGRLRRLLDEVENLHSSGTLRTVPYAGSDTMLAIRDEEKP